MERVTIRDIAKKAGLSTAAVSRALRNDKGQSRSTCAKVKALAETMGYQPDPFISALVKRRWQRGGEKREPIAWLTTFPTLEEWQSVSQRGPFNHEVFKGAFARAAQQGYRLEHFGLHGPDMNEARLSRILFNRGIRGLCIAPLPSEKTELDMQWDHFACATIGYSFKKPDLHRACPHHFTGIGLSLKSLRSAGHRHIGVCLDEQMDLRVGHNWSAGIFLFQQQYPDTRVSVYSGQETDLEFEIWFNATRPDVILTNKNSAFVWIEKKGLAVPIASLSWSPELSCPGLDQLADKVGEVAIDLIVGQIQRNETGVPEDPRVVMIEGKWRSAPVSLARP